MTEQIKKNIYFAPLEGITGYIYRTTYEEHFGGIDRYFSPFVVTRDGGVMKKKEMRDILPENNKNITLVPQVLTNHSANFIQAASQMHELGYEEVNLNLGCPSGTVVSKGRGSGFLARPFELEKFLDEIFEKTPCDISIKTRIGVTEPEEFDEILELYNKYPVKELTIHPRTRKEFYKGTVHMDVFDKAYGNAKMKLCYNGDILTEAERFEIEKKYPELLSIMIGRGFIATPGFTGNDKIMGKSFGKKELKEFSEHILERYLEVMSGEIHALHKMKELWIFMAPQFTNYEKYLKNIKKTKKLSEYKVTVASLFSNEDLNS